MKKWWIGYQGATETVRGVEVTGTVNAGSKWAQASTTFDTQAEQVPLSDLCDSELDAKAAVIHRQADELEAEADSEEEYADECSERAQNELESERTHRNNAKRLFEQAVATRAKASELWDALGEVNDKESQGTT